MNSKILLFGQWVGNQKQCGETNGASGSAAVTRSGVQPEKPKKKKESAATLSTETGFSFRGRLLEVASPLEGEAVSDGRKFKAVLLQEGLGNFKDCFYYTAEALQSAIPVFEGKKLYVDHPSETDEMDRPERSVRDIAGYFENVHVEILESGQSALCGDLIVLDGTHYEPVRSLMKESTEYSKKHKGQDLVGLSINADGDHQETALELFLKDGVPEGCLDKLVSASEQGITTIYPVVKITSAVSCDLVTEAGAGGRIAQLLEKEIVKMKAKEAHKEDLEKKEKKEEEKKEAKEGEGKKEDSADGKDGAHPDAAQDEELIKKMLAKYLGDGHDEETMSLAKEALKHAKDMGMDEDEAMKCAGYNMKMAKHIQKLGKEKAAATDANDTPAAAASTGADQVTPAHPDKKDQMEKKESAKKPSSEDKLVALTAENAGLKAKLAAHELEKFVDRTLRESGLPMAATKQFRSLIKESKTEKEVTEKLSVFKEGYVRGGEADDMGFIFSAEKTETKNTDQGMNFSDCVEE